MEKITFIDLKKSTMWKGLAKNEVRVKLTGKDRRIIFNQRVTKELNEKRFSFVKVGVGEESQCVYLIFNKESGYPIPDAKKYRVYIIRGKGIVNFLEDHFNLKGDTPELCISDNIAQHSDFCTYKLYLPRQESMTIQEPKEDRKSDINQIGFSVKETLELSGTDLEEMGINIPSSVKTTIDKFGSLGDVYRSDPNELIRKERGIGSMKVKKLKSLFSSLGLTWEH